jgi:alkylated DNA repair dioxygenase AlkB
MSQAHQADLFAANPALPPGFAYRPDLLPAAEQDDLAPRIAALPFRAFEFRGFLGNRRIVSFGWRYDFSAGKLEKAGDIPAFLLPLRAVAAVFAGLSPEELQHALVTEYPPGAAIGWHKDKASFDDVIGVSLISPCLFRVRKRSGSAWQRASLRLEPGSAYLLRGEARAHWEHSIPAVERLRYSITFRTLRR